jgi:hypothetical protein
VYALLNVWFMTVMSIYRIYLAKWLVYVSIKHADLVI